MFSFLNRFILISCLLIFFSSLSNAQIDSLVNSGKSISSAKKWYDSGRFDLAIKELHRIDPRDTNYYYSLSELAKAYYENKQYAEAVLASEKGMAKPSPYRAQLYNTFARALSSQGKYDRAYALLNEAKKEFPLDFVLVFRHGVILYQENKYAEAEEQFFKSLDLAPYLSGAHLYLAELAMRRGDKAEGMFAMGLYLAINNQANRQLQLLERFVKNEITDEGSIETTPDNPFAKLNEIIRSKITFDPGYKTKIPIDAGIVKQYQLLFEQISGQEYDKNNPWVKFYVTIYKDLIKANMQEIFIYHLLESTTIKQVTQWKEKNKKLYQPFYDKTNTALNQLRAKRTLPASWGYKNPVACSYHNDGHIESIGDKDAQGNRIGKWYYYAENGVRIADGNYQQDEKTGTWNYFNDSGIATSIENYDTDEIISFNTEGGLRSKYILKNKGIVGPYELFYLCGALKENRNYNKEGKREGPGKAYYPNGKLSTEFSYKEDSLHGRFIEWYESGIKMAEEELVNGKPSEKYTSYYWNGKINSTGNYENGKANGVWTYYHENGRLRKKGSFVGDKAIGQWDTYNKNGELEEKIIYGDQGDFDADEYYYDEGKLHYSLRSKKDAVISLTYYDKNGKEISALGNTEGTFEGKGYFSTGEVRVELRYLKGERSGTWKYFYRHGNVQSVNDYRNGLLEGKYTEYHENGNLKIESNYTEGKLDGLYKEYGKNGKLKTSGWYVQNQKQQKWYTYHTEGTLESDSYFLDDTQVGYTLTYNEDGKLSSKIEFDEEGKIKMVTYYNQDGIASSEATVTEPNQLTITQKYQSGKIAQQAVLLCREWNGQTQVILSNGKTYKSDSFVNDGRTGKYTTCFSDGKVEGTGFYEDGLATGEWKWYYDNGNKYSEGKYLQGGRDSIWTYYYPGGQISSTINYSGDIKHGESQIIALDGKIVLYKKYHTGDLIAYRLYDKEGKLSDWLPFTGNENLVSYFPNGKVAVSEYYKNGEYDKERTIYFPSGKIQKQTHYKNGMNEGESIEYYPDGKLKEKGTFKDDLATGTWEYYDSNGNLSRKEPYLGGELNGKVEYFSNGKNTGSQLFRSGIPVD